MRPVSLTLCRNHIFNSWIISLKQKFKILGLTIGLVGLIAAVLDLKGCFRDDEKLALAERIHSQSGGIAKDTPAFEKFLLNFPPPAGVDTSAITHIVKDKLQTHDGYPVAITLRYLVGAKKTAPVATYQEVKKWAELTNYGWWAWSIAIVGWLLVVILESLDFWEKKRISKQWLHADGKKGATELSRWQ